MLGVKRRVPRKVVNYLSIIGVKVYRLGGKLTSYLLGSFLYGVYLYVKDFRSEKGAILFVYDDTVTVGYKVLTGKFKVI